MVPSCVVLCWGFTAQSTQWGHVEHGQFTQPQVYWAGLVLQAVNQYCAHSFARKGQILPKRINVFQNASLLTNGVVSMWEDVSLCVWVLSA